MRHNLVSARERSVTPWLARKNARMTAAAPCRGIHAMGSSLGAHIYRTTVRRSIASAQRETNGPPRREKVLRIECCAGRGGDACRFAASVDDAHCGACAHARYRRSCSSMIVFLARPASRHA